MKYYTWGWWSGDIDPTKDNQIQRQVRSYGNYFDSVREAFPSSVVSLSDEYTLHDAELITLKANFVNNKVSLNLEGYSRDDSERCQYYLLFSGVVELSTVGNPEQPLGGPGGFGHLGYNEFEVLGDNLYESRMLFSTGIELILQWSDFSFEVKVIEEK